MNNLRLAQDLLRLKFSLMSAYKMMRDITHLRKSDETPRAGPAHERQARSFDDSPGRAYHSQDLLQKLSQQVPGVIYQFRLFPDGRSCFPYASEAIRTIYEVTPEQVREDASAVFALLHPEDYAGVVASIQESASKLTPWQYEYRVILPIQGMRWRLGDARPERHEDGSILWHGFITDITDRKQVEQALRESQKHTQLVLEATHDHLWLWDIVTDGLQWSDTVRELPAFPAAELRTQASFRQRIHPDDLAAYDASIQDVFASGKDVWECEWRFRRADGSYAWIHGRGRVVRDERGNPVQMTGASVDISERKYAEAALRESEERFRSLYEFSPVGIALNAMTGQFLQANRALFEMTGYTEEEFYTLSYWDITPREYEPQEQVQLESLSSRRVYGPYEKEYIRKDGSRIPVLLNGALITDRNGNELIWSIVQDISDRKRAEAEIANAQLFLNSIIENIPNMIFVKDAEDLRFVRFNKAGEELLGCQRSELLGKTDYDLFCKDEADFFTANDHAVLQNGQLMDIREEPIQTRDKGLRYLHTKKIPLYDETGRPRYLLGISEDITDRKKSEERIWQLAHYDFLTKLPNRALFNDRLSQTIVAARRQRKSFAVMFLDLDRFKNVNDSLGHTTGDELLLDVASRISATLRDTDTVCRQGGDEFVILLREINQADDVAQIARKLVNALSTPYKVSGHELVVTVSIGISVFPEDGQDLDTLLKNADSAMYHAKGAGRNTFQFFTQNMNNRSFEILLLENSLRRALERNELLLLYQPQIDCSSGRIVGMEALIRWHHPELGLIPPGKFIPIAEESGLIVPIGEWVIHEACRQNKTLQEAGLLHAPMAVNLSAIQFRQSNISAIIEGALHASGLEARYLELEVTESAFVEDVERAIATMQALKMMGVSLAVDDFGTGYSSLAYLKRFPIDKLKVDRSFVRDITTDPGDASLCSAIISLAQNLELEVIAEGVETDAQLAFLQEHGCAVMQGFYFSRPIAAADLSAFLRS